MITINNISVNRRKTQILKNVSFNITPNSIHGFIGPNGAGKTTTIKAILGSIPISKGTISFERSKQINSKEIVNFGYVPESLKYNPNYKIKKLLKEHCRYNDINKKDFDIKFKKFNNHFSISDFLNTKISKLSSGQQKLVMLFLAIIEEPDLLILDEPMENLDPTVRMDFFSYLSKYSKQNNKSIFISSHVLEELQDFCNYITLLKKGEIVYSGSANIKTNQIIVEIESKDIIKIKKLFKNNKCNIKGNVIYVSFDATKNISIKDITKKLISHNIDFLGVNIKKTSLVDIYKNFIINKNKGKHE